MLFFQLALNADEPFARSMDGKAAEIAPDPFATEFFGNGECCTGTAEEVGDKVTGVG